MLPTHCTALGYDVLGTTFTVRYTAPVHARMDHDLRWVVTATTTHRRGELIDWTGTVCTLRASSASRQPDRS
jgi:hypothetical protein